MSDAGIIIVGDNSALLANVCHGSAFEGLVVFGDGSQRNYGKGNAVAPDCQIDFQPGGTYC